MKRVGQKSRLKNLNLSQELLERLISDLHVLNGIQDRKTVRETTLDLHKGLSERIPFTIALQTLLGHKESDLADGLDTGQKTRDDRELDVFLVTARLDSGGHLIGGLS